MWPFEAPGIGARSLEQIDGAIHVGGLHVIVESKDQAASQDIEPIAKLRNQLLRRPSGAVGVCFSTGGFTPSARLLAHVMAPHMRDMVRPQELWRVAMFVPDRERALAELAPAEERERALREPVAWVEERVRAGDVEIFKQHPVVREVLEFFRAASEKADAA